MSKHDHQHYEQDYFEKRAEAELELAQAATHTAAVKAHYELAGMYLDIVHGTPETDAPVAGETMAESDD